MNCKICGEKLKGKQRSYCCEEHARQGKNNATNSWRYANKEKVKEYGKIQRTKINLISDKKTYKDYTHMLPVDLMLKINRELITLKKSKEKVLSEYEKNKYFKYIKIHVERVTKGA